MPSVDVSEAPLPRLPERAQDSHKGSYGRVLVIGGSQGKAGAAALAGKSALRSGAGLVTIAVPAAVQEVVASFEASCMTLGCGTTDHLRLEDADALQQQIAGADCVALGPGLGTEATTERLVQHLYHSVSVPMVVDADGLNALAQHSQRLERPGGPRILTPHPGEFARLSQEPYDAAPSARRDAAARLCLRDRSESTIVVLKGDHTVVSDSHQCAVNTTGNPGMATGGSGDVLTGVIAALVGQGLTPWEAARLGVHVHGLAGDLAAVDFGQVSLIASDLLDYLPDAFKQLTAVS